MSRSQWYETGWLILATLCLSALPLLWPTIPPLIDLPGHMAGYTIEQELGVSPDLQQYYSFDWQVIGNLGLELIMVPLGRFLGVEPATKLIAIAIPVITAAGFLTLSRQAHGRVPPTAYAAMPLIFNYWFMYGFMNFCLAAGLVMLSLALWLYLSARRQLATRTVVFLGISIAIWLAHAVGWVMLIAVCGTAELRRRLENGESAPQAFAMSIVTSLPLLAPVLLMIVFPSGERLSAYGWFNLAELVRSVVLTLRDRWLPIDAIALLFIFGLIIAATLKLGGLRFRPQLAWPAMALIATFLLAPVAINGSYFVNGRIFPYGSALLLLSIDSSRLSVSRKAVLAGTSVAFMVLKLSSNAVSFALYDSSYKSQLEALLHIPRGAAVMSVQQVPCETGLSSWFNPRLYNLPAMAVVRNHAFTNTNFAVRGLHLIRARYPEAGSFEQSGSGNVTIGDRCRGGFGRPVGDVLSKIPYAAFDVVWLLDIPRADWPSDANLQLVWSTEASALFVPRHDPPTSHRR